MTKHTPGPWVVDGPGIIRDEASTDGDHIDASVFGDTIEENRANAVLIAAAPEMFEALDEVHRAVYCGNGKGPVMNQVRAWHKVCAVLDKIENARI